MAVSIEKIVNLHKTPSKIRNICILGHVDHGKTTVTDALIASNGIISQRMAGKLRYMDSREDEQMRGITMKSSAISLVYNEHLFNVIDSPGHIDFSSEVSTAVRLCDGAVILVDVVEGVSAQTHAVLRQAWSEGIPAVLVLNKIDRLITELRLEADAAYVHLRQIIQQVNVVMSELFTADVMLKTAQETKTNEKIEEMVVEENKVYDWTLGDTDDSNIYFSPERGNVVFASAIDGWAFSIRQFAQMLSTKLGMNAGVLRKTLWGDFYLQSKTKRILKGAQIKGKKALFVQLVLENVWSVYEAICINRDQDKVDRIVASMKLKISQRDLHHVEARVCLRAVMSQWLPLHLTVLDTIADQLPSPNDMSESRVEHLLSHRSQPFAALPPRTRLLKQAFLDCSPDSAAPVIVYVSKMFPVDRSILPQNKPRPLTAEQLKERHAKARQRLAEKSQQTNRQESTNAIGKSEENSDDGTVLLDNQYGTKTVKGDDDVFLAFARVFSGSLYKGQRLLVLGPKHDPSQISDDTDIDELLGSDATLADLPTWRHVSAVTLQELHVCMGRELESVDEVPAGNVIAIQGLEDHILKSATLSTTPYCPTFTDMYLEASAIVSVAIEPVNTGDMSRLTHGLRLLHQADPCVRVLVRETGEHVIITAGEVHLQRCVRDLETRYAKIKLNVSAPIVPFRETITTPPTVDMVNEVIDETNTKLSCNAVSDDNDGGRNNQKTGVVEIYTANRKHLLHIRALPLPDGIVRLIEENSDLIKTMENIAMSRGKLSGLKQGSRGISTEMETDIESFKQKLSDVFNKCDKVWCNAAEKVWSFGPRRNGPNVLLNNVPNYGESIWRCLRDDGSDSHGAGIVNGFQMATLSGPICGEPMSGVCFSLEKWESCDDGGEKSNGVIHDAHLATVDGSSVEIRDDVISDNIREMSSDRINSEGRLTKGHADIDASGSRHTLAESERLLDIGDSNVLNQNERVRGEDKSLDSCPNMVTDKSCFIQSKGEFISKVSVDDEVNAGVDSSVVAGSSNQVDMDEDGNVSQSNTTSRDGVMFCEQVGVMSPQTRYRGRSYGDDDSSDDNAGDDDPGSTPPELGRVTEGSMSGVLMSCVRAGCQRAFTQQPQRLMAAMYECQILATADVLGRLYAVIGKRFGRVLSEELREGTQMFTVIAVLPVVESFGFAEEIRTKTSGLASPQLKFSHWQVVDVDPYWVPSTEEEYAHYGEKADSENRARVYMNTVRRRKGLSVEEQIVEHGEKQRTLKKNK